MGGAPTFWWCVLVLSVSSEGIVGAIDELPDTCSACTKSMCKSISGIYTKPDLPTGYSLVAQIPEGACKVSVQQLRHTSNHIALKNANGSFIINGDWRFSPSTIIDQAGTRFVYHKSDESTMESIAAAGPLTNPVDILVVYQEPNYGIKYGYMLPMFPTTAASPDLGVQIAPPYLKRPIEPRRLEPPVASPNFITQRDEARSNNNFHRRRVRRRFHWKVTGLSSCSKSCGGGVQMTLYACMREHTQTPVAEKKCAHLERPHQTPIRCNVDPCTPLTYWKGAWTSCSGSCGEGIQRYVFKCHQEDFSGRVIILDDSACSSRLPKPEVANRHCKLPACPSENDITLAESSNGVDKRMLSVDSPEWQVGTWSQCSVSCGTGHRSRSVTCPGGKCLANNRPHHAEYCDSGTCSTGNTTSSWLVSEWSQCSESCGTGQQARMAFCWKPDCQSDQKPETTRSCSSDRYCVGQWFTGPWSTCPESCADLNKQHRDVVCMVKVRGQLRITNEMTCPSQEKPTAERPCTSSCQPRWFVGDWGRCEGRCPSNGVQHREVRCLDNKGAYSLLCLADEKPLVKRTCKCDIREEQANIPAHDEPQDQNCVDKLSNCNLAVKARLCHYEYYLSSCCLSCTKVS